MKLPNTSRAIEAQDEDVLLAMCIFGEARGQSNEAKLGVANVVKNRLAASPRFGLGWSGVILKRWQFSCFLPGDPNRAKLLRPLDYEKPETWARCWEIARKVYDGIEHDNTLGATHYFDDSLKDCPPAWARVYVPTVKIGRLNFFRAPQPGPAVRQATEARPKTGPPSKAA